MKILKFLLVVATMLITHASSSPAPSPKPTINHYQGTRVTYHSAQPFSVVTARLFSSIGTTSKFPSIAAQITPTTTPADLAGLVTPALGPHGFMFFARFNHSAWLPVYKLPSMANPSAAGPISSGEGIDYHRGILRVILGNPILAETMLQYDLTAGLALPVEVLLLETKDRKGCDVVYQLPSALVAGVAGNESENEKNKLLKAAKVLDGQLEAFVQYLVI